MSDPFLAEIRIFGFNFAPKGWALCNGALLSISQNTALFSLLGTMYGGNGSSNFGLPDLQGRVPMNYGNGVGLTPHIEGEVGGSNTVTLTAKQMPIHNHSVLTANDDADLQIPIAQAALAKSVNANFYSSALSTPGAMDQSTIGFVGGNGPHNNMQPFLVLNFCIALQGIFPARP